MIPRAGTKRRQVYDRLVAGASQRTIRQDLGLSRAAYDNHRHFITSWAKANASSLAVKRR